MLDGLKNFLSLINDNWTTLTVIFGLVIILYQKIKVYINKTTEEKIEISKKQIREVILRLVSEAELDYDSWVSAGMIKRSQVIDQIFSMYPALSNVVNQEEIIDFIDNCIDESLDVLRDIIEENEDSFVITTKEGE